MTGRRGCLGRLVLLILLAWPIEELAGLFGWSDATTGYVLLGAIALLAVGASGQREGIAVKRGEAREVRAALFRGRYRIWQARGMSAPRHERPGDRPMHERGELGGEAGNAPAGGGGIPVHQGVPRARDPLPAGLRFRILARDGFRCRYCGRPGSTSGVVLHVDYVVPQAAGGATSEDNLRTACEECNLGKGVRVVVPAGSWWVRTRSGEFAPSRRCRARGKLSARADPLARDVAWWGAGPNGVRRLG